MPLRFTYFAVLVVMVFFTSNASAATKPIPVIFDTDIGSDIDDMIALSLILKSPELDLKMVTTATEDTAYRAKVAAKFLALAGRSDIPVGLGPAFDAKAEFHKPWVKDYALTDYPGIIEHDGVAAMAALIRASDTPVTIIAAGPMHNIAKLVNMAPDVVSKVNLVGMHGSIYQGYEGESPSAEYNVANNPAAFRNVLAQNWRSFTITPLDTCGDITIGGEQYQQLRHSKDKQLQTIFENYGIWSSLVTWDTVDYLDTRTSILYDVIAVYLALPNHDWLPVESMNIKVTDDGFTQPAPQGRPLDVALNWQDEEAFKAWFTQRMLRTRP